MCVCLWASVMEEKPSRGNPSFYRRSSEEALQAFSCPMSCYPCICSVPGLFDFPGIFCAWFRLFVKALCVGIVVYGHMDSRK